MDSLWLAALFAVFIWWFSTGLVLLLDNLPKHTFRWSRWISSALALAALWALVHTAQQPTLAGVYCAFTSALLVWGWHELSFLTGWVTGPRKQGIAARVQGWPRFRAATAAILWHELAIAATGVFIVVVTWDAPNPVGAWTYLVLWLMRISAKLNLFLGVRNLSEEFLPPHLKYLASFFRRRRMNLLFPFAVTAATAVAVLLVQMALMPVTGPALAVGLTLVATMLVLAIVEHWLLVLPLPATALWRWAMRHQDPADTSSSPHGGPAADAAPRTVGAPVPPTQPRPC
jgi:putative photosynthetic complex assembly protein 2